MVTGVNWLTAKNDMALIPIENPTDAVERLKSKGMEVNEVDKSAFVEAVQPVWDTFKKENGSELIDLAVSYND